MIAVEIPHDFIRADGETVRGTRTVVLCPSCDRDDDAAQGILAFFSLNPGVDAMNVREAGELIQEWIESLVQRGTPSLDLDEHDHPDLE